MLRRSALAVLFVAVLALPAAANGRTTDVAFGWAVASLPGSQEWIRITNTDDENSIRLASVHGISFNITSVVSVRASGAETPTCTVSTAPTSFDYLYCNGNLPPDSTLLVVVGISGSGHDFEIAASDAVDPSTLEYAPDTDLGSLLPVTANLVKTPTTQQVTFTSGGHPYDEIEVLPHGFAITKVDSITPAGSECDLAGAGIDCTVALPANATGTITFESSGATSGTPTADVILSGDDGFGNAFVTQTQGPAATYDLITKAQPSVVTYKRGQKLAAHPIRFTVTNAGSSTIASSPVTVTQTVSGSPATKLLRAKLSCQPKIRTTPSLQPGKSATACTLALAPTRPIARNAGKLNVTVAVACTAPETSCANNRARATIVVK